MTDEKFTQGEWKHCIFGGECGYPLVFEKKTGLRVASIFIQNGDTENGIANAALIAAAPEMYALLSIMVSPTIMMSENLRNDELRNAIKAVLKKARGEE